MENKYILYLIEDNAQRSKRISEMFQHPYNDIYIKVNWLDANGIVSTNIIKADYEFDNIKENLEKLKICDKTIFFVDLALNLFEDKKTMTNDISEYRAVTARKIVKLLTSMKPGINVIFESGLNGMNVYWKNAIFPLYDEQNMDFIESILFNTDDSKELIVSKIINLFNRGAKNEN